MKREIWNYMQWQTYQRDVVLVRALLLVGLLDAATGFALAIRMIAIGDRAILNRDA